MKFSILVTTGQDFKNWQDCFKHLAGLLEKEKKVKPGYWDSVLEREKNFPTGLQVTPTVGIAIPHPSNPKLSLESTIAVSILPNPIEVCSMAEPDEKIMVSVVLMLALEGSEDHLIMLQQMMETFQDESLLQNLLIIKDTQVIQKLLEDRLGASN